jgi:four helix bundle protein
VGARRIEELVVWQLAHELRSRVYALIATGPAAADRRFCDQIRQAVASVPANIAEGFGRETHREFARFLNIARGSLFEVAEHLKDGVARSHWTPRDTQDLEALTRRTIAALTRLIKYLRSAP